MNARYCPCFSVKLVLMVQQDVPACGRVVTASDVFITQDRTLALSAYRVFEPHNNRCHASKGTQQNLLELRTLSNTRVKTERRRR